MDQVREFGASVAAKPDYAPWTADNALFGVWIGVNDVGNTFWLGNVSETNLKIMDVYFAQLQTLYEAGARRFAILSVPRKPYVSFIPICSLLFHFVYPTPFFNT